MNSKMAQALAALADAGRAIASVRSIQAVKEVHDAAEAQIVAAKRAGMPAEVQNMLAEVSLRAARRAGELLAETSLSHGGRPAKEDTAKQGKNSSRIGAE